MSRSVMAGRRAERWWPADVPNGDGRQTRRAMMAGRRAVPSGDGRQTSRRVPSGNGLKFVAGCQLACPPTESPKYCSSGFKKRANWLPMPLLEFYYTIVGIPLKYCSILMPQTWTPSHIISGSKCSHIQVRNDKDRDFPTNTATNESHNELCSSLGNTTKQCASVWYLSYSMHSLMVDKIITAFISTVLPT